MGDFRRIAGAFGSVGRQSVIAMIASWALMLACTGPSQANAPSGVYAHLDFKDLIGKYVKNGINNDGESGWSLGPCSAPLGLSTSDVQNLHKALRSLYATLLSNPEVAGIAVGAHWCLIQLYNPTTCGLLGVGCNGFPDGNDWSYLDDVFKEAAKANKTVLLQITPGNDSPSWVFGPGTSCDLVIEAIAPPFPSLPDCESVTFSQLPEKVNGADSLMLPLPWSSAYTGAWNTFLGELAARYNAPSTLYPNVLVAIDVAGPSSQSSEMILPTTASQSIFQANPTLPVDSGWVRLIRNSFPEDPDNYFTNPDQAFIVAWSNAVTAYETAFSGIALVLVPDDGEGLPELGTPFVPSPSEPSWVAMDCSTTASDQFAVSCSAKAQIINAFVGTNGGANQLATEDDGLTAARSIYPGNLGVPGAKLLTSPYFNPLSVPPILGGSQFDFAVSTGANTQTEGCEPPPTGCPTTPEQGAYNVLADFFSGTVAAGHYFYEGNQESPGFPPYPPGMGMPSAPMHFLTMEYQDICYAAAPSHACPSSCPNPNIPPPPSAPYCASMQDLISLASRDLSATGKGTPLGPGLSSSAPCTHVPTLSACSKPFN